MKHEPYYNLKAEMARRNFNIKDIAEVLGCSVPTAGGKINGNIGVTFNEAEKIRSLFSNCSIEYLFDYAKKVSPPTKDYWNLVHEVKKLGLAQNDRTAAKERTLRNA